MDSECLPLELWVSTNMVVFLWEQQNYDNGDKDNGDNGDDTANDNVLNVHNLAQNGESLNYNSANGVEQTLSTLVQYSG